MRPPPEPTPRSVEPADGITFTRPLAPEPEKKAKEKVKKADGAKKVPMKKGKHKAKKKTASKRAKDDIGVITIVESGVYEIDVGKLLDDSPIIIEKDGTYLIHLPSLLEGKGKK